MTQRRLKQFDLTTGEVLDGFVAYILPKRQNGFGTRWMAMAQEALDLLANAGLNGQDYRVLMKLLAKLDFQNLLVLNQAEIARELTMHRQHVQRSVKRLIGMGILLEGPRIGVSRSYRLNPRFGWKGSARNHVIALEEERKRRGLEVIEGGASAASHERDPNTIDMFEG